MVVAIHIHCVAQKLPSSVLELLDVVFLSHALVALATVVMAMVVLLDALQALAIPPPSPHRSVAACPRTPTPQAALDLDHRVGLVHSLEFAELIPHLKRASAPDCTGLASQMWIFQ